MYRPLITAQIMADAAEAAYNQNDSADGAAITDAIALIGELIRGTKTPEEVQAAIDMNADPSNDWYTEDYAKAFKAVWESLFLKLTN